MQMPGNHRCFIPRRFVALEEAPRLYAGMLRLRGSPDAWRIVAAAAVCLSGVFARAQVRQIH